MAVTPMIRKKPTVNPVKPRAGAPNVATRISPGSVPARKKPFKAGYVGPGRVGVTLKDEPLTFTPGVLDTTGMLDWNDLIGSYDLNRKRLETGRDTTLNDIRIRELMQQENMQKGLQAADSNAAARGVFNSGIRLGNRDTVASESSRAASELMANRQAAIDNATNELSGLESSFLSDKDRIYQAANDRRYQTFLKDSSNLPGPRKVQLLSKSQFLTYQKNRAKGKNPYKGMTPAQIDAIYQKYVVDQTDALRRKYGFKRGVRQQVPQGERPDGS